MWMTPGEICREYRQAKDKAAQVGILADLNSCSKAEIRDILLQHGIQAKSRKIAVRVSWTAEEEQLCRQLVELGASRAEIVKRIPRHTRRSVDNKLYTMGYITERRIRGQI